jgi:hypothetical protein
VAHDVKRVFNSFNHNKIDVSAEGRAVTAQSV